MHKSTQRQRYEAYMDSDAWRIMRIKRIQADLGLCQGIVLLNGKRRLCLSRSALEVHHLTYTRLGNEKLEDLITLCKSCHMAIHAKDNTPKQNTAKPTHQPQFRI